jgi:predicted RNase H-like nuclease (RuvC/YqgF family)
MDSLSSNKPKSLIELLGGGKLSLPPTQREAKKEEMFAQQEEDIRNDDLEETEIPSSSTILDRNSDLLSLLGIHQSPSTSSFPSDKDSEDVPQLDVNCGNRGNDAIIECYSTIAFLKKDNKELHKEVEFLKKSKDLAIKEFSSKYDHRYNQNEKEIHSLTEKARNAEEKYSEMKSTYDQLKRNHDALFVEKNEFENQLKKSQEDETHYRSALLEENSSLVLENKNLKLEITRLSENLEKKSRSAFDGASTNQRLHDKEMEIEELRIEVHRLQQLLKKLEDEVGYLWS